MNTYSIPKGSCTTNKEYQEYCSGLNFVFNTDERCIYPDFEKETATVDGTITGFDLI